MAKAAQTARSPRPKLLCVDDGKQELQLRRAFLKMHGYNVLTASDGFQALEILRQHRMDIVLLDFQMPGMNGSQTARRIREIQPDARIILFSGYLEPIPASEAALFDAVVWKGEPLHLLLDTLQHMTSKVSSSEQGRTSRKPSTAMGQARPSRHTRTRRS